MPQNTNAILIKCDRVTQKSVEEFFNKPSRQKRFMHLQRHVGCLSYISTTMIKHRESKERITLYSLVLLALYTQFTSVQSSRFQRGLQQNPSRRGIVKHVHILPVVWLEFLKETEKRSFEPLEPYVKLDSTLYFLCFPSVLTYRILD